MRSDESIAFTTLVVRSDERGPKEGDPVVIREVSSPS